MKPPVNMHVQVAGIYRVRTYTPDGILTQDTGEFHNLITNTGMDLFGSITSSTASCSQFVFVGSGNATPVFTDTQLQSLVTGFGINSTSATTYVPAAGTQPNYWTVTTTYVSGVGQAAGNLSEIGVGPVATTLFSRALILDNTGAPTTITVLSTEVLQVTYEFRIYFDISTVISSYAISAVSYATQTRIMNLASPIGGGQLGMRQNATGPSGLAYQTQTLAAITGLPTGPSASYGNIFYIAYTNGTFFLDGTISSAIGNSNLSGGIGSLGISTRIGFWQISHTPTIPKDNTKTMTLNFRVSWARFTPPP